MIRMLIIGHCYGIRSERRLCEKVQLNLVYRWFCRLGLQDPIPSIQVSPKTGMAAFVTAMPFVTCLKWF